MKSVFPNDSIDPVTSLMEDSKAPHFPTPKGPSLVAQRVKNPPMMQETWVQSLGWADPLEKGMAIHSRDRCQGLENFMDREAWQATVHRVSKSWT